jgi:hypothetical protein
MNNDQEFIFPRLSDRRLPVLTKCQTEYTGRSNNIELFEKFYTRVVPSDNTITTAIKNRIKVYNVS